MTIKLVFEIEPIQQARPRVTRMGRGIRLYDPQKVSVYKKQLGLMAKDMYKAEPLVGPLELRIKFYRPIQKSISRKEHKRRADGISRPVVKPDLSNYLKAFEDGLNGIIWKDDASIVHEEIDKYYSDNPRIELEIEDGSDKNE